MNDAVWKVHARMQNGIISGWEVSKAEHPEWADALQLVLAQPLVKSAVVRLK